MILFREIIAFALDIQKSSEIKSIEHLEQAIDQAGFRTADAQRVRILLTQGARALDDRIRSLPGMVTVAKSVCAYLEMEFEEEFKLCRKIAGSTTEAIYLLMSNMKPSKVDLDKADERLSLDDVIELYVDLSSSKSGSGAIDHKLHVLNRIWESLNPLEIRWFLYFFKSPMSVLGINPEYVHSNLTDSVPLPSIRLTIIHATRIGRPNQPRFVDFVLGVNVSDDDRFVQDYIPIGKINGRPDEEIAAQLDALLADTIIEKFGPTVAFEPTLVLEVSHRGIRQNNRTKAGYVLIEPSINTILSSINISDVVTLRDLVAVG
jgi:hypothetical protein